MIYADPREYINNLSFEFTKGKEKNYTYYKS